tara:strand:- start:1 stop:279 length:279 start_codon:yes stop_codon:yes gene_type:complete
MTQKLKQRRRQNFTRKQKGGGFFDFLQINVPVGENVKGFFSGLKARFTRKKTLTEKVADAPKQVMTGVSTVVKNMAAKPVFGGTRKRKQRKN